MNRLKYVVPSLIFCLGSANTLLAEQVNIELIPEDTSIKYQYALVSSYTSPDDESAIVDPEKLRFKDVKRGVTLRFDDVQPYYVHIKEKDSSSFPFSYPLKNVRSAMRSGGVDHLIIRAGSGKNPQPSIGFGYKQVVKPSKSRK